jgi:hypothetical protein
VRAGCSISRTGAIWRGALWFPHRPSIGFTSIEPREYSPERNYFA